MAKKNPINELCEILATAVAGKPELNERLTSLLGSRSNAAPAQGEETAAQRKMRIRQRFNRLHIKEQLKQTA